MNTAVLAGRNVESDLVPALDHYTVGADIDPAGLRVARNVIGTRADIAAAVVFVPDRRRKGLDVDVVAFDDILQNRAVLDDYMGNLLQILHIGLAKRVGEFDFGQLGRKTERHVHALAGEEIHQKPRSFKRARDFFKDNAGRFVAVLDNLGRHADIAFPARPFDMPDLAELLGLFKPLAHIRIRNVHFIP